MAPMPIRVRPPTYSPGSPLIGFSESSPRVESPIYVPEPLTTPEPRSPDLAQPPACPSGSPTPRPFMACCLGGSVLASPAPHIPGTPTPQPQQHHQRQRLQGKANLAYILCQQRPPFHYDEAIAAPRPVPLALTEQTAQKTLARWTAEDEQRTQAREQESRWSSCKLTTYLNAPIQAAPDRTPPPSPSPPPSPPVMRVADSEALRWVFTLEELQADDEDRETLVTFYQSELEKTEQKHHREEQEQRRQEQEQRQQQQQPNGYHHRAPVAVAAFLRPPVAREPTPYRDQCKQQQEQQQQQQQQQQEQPYGLFGCAPVAAAAFLPPFLHRFGRWRPWEL
ncbi:uncharacterized protein PG986_006802 [Apiospora aurea]|uniref:Uncharacterized protein n=1 Tax=Apiospora aurea TaxID=335848 RepID=A0ABR1QB17_9PEZI